MALAGRRGGPPALRTGGAPPHYPAAPAIRSASWAAASMRTRTVAGQQQPLAPFRPGQQVALRLGQPQQVAQGLQVPALLPHQELGARVG